MLQTIESNRISLKACDFDSLVDLHILLQDTDNVTYTCFPTSQGYDNLLYLNQYVYSKDNFAYLITSKEHNCTIGYISVHSISIKHRFASITCLLAKQFQGNGFMTEAFTLLLKNIFIASQIQRIEAQIYVENYASITLFEKQGFVREGRLRKNFMIKNILCDSYLYALLKEDFNK